MEAAAHRAQRLAIAVSREYDRFHPDDLPLIEALPRLGMRPEPCVWNDPNLDWSAFDGVLVRTIWDYYRRYPEYLAWLERLERIVGSLEFAREILRACAKDSAEIRADYRDAIPLARYGLEEELAASIFFLCSDRASYITGQMLCVDGGFEATGIGLPTLRGEGRNG